jgi:hypothetical protein
MLTYLLPLALISFKVGCRVEHSLRRLRAALNMHQCLPKIVAFAASTTLPYQVPSIRFDTDSFIIGVDTFASITLRNHPDQIENLKEHNNAEMEGIQGELSIKDTGTFKFHIKDDKGGVHLIKIPNSKYVPDLKVCLLLPHHWVQEVKDHYPVPKGTKTDTNNEALTLIWNQQKYRRTILYHPLTNTPSFCTALASRTYRAFVALVEAAEAQYHQWGHVLQMPGQLHLHKDFTAKENVHTSIPKKPITDSEGATSNNLTVQASNLSSGKGDKEEKETTRMGPLTFNINTELEEDKHVYLAAVDDQAKLMRWHYCLGHLSFANLKQLALNGEISQRLAKVKPPACMGCLFGAMTKVPWKGRETSSEVFVTTKSGAMCQCGSTCINASGLHCPAEGDTHQEALRGSHRLCGPLLLAQVHPSDDQAHLRGDHVSHASLRTLCQAARRPHPPLPLQQRTICRQRLQEQLQCQRMATHLLWGQCPLPKWYCRESHQRSPGECAEATPPCTPMLACHHPLGPLALCTQECCQPPQYLTCFGG